MASFCKTNQSLSPVRGIGACVKETLSLRITGKQDYAQFCHSSPCLWCVPGGGDLAHFCLPRPPGLCVFSLCPLGRTSLTSGRKLQVLARSVAET